MLREAVIDCSLSRDPTLGVKALPEEPQQHTILTMEELSRFLSETKKLYPQHFGMVTVLATTGLRFGEASALCWDDIDEKKQLIYVRHRQVRGKTAPPKSRKYRSVAAPLSVFELLSAHRQEMLRHQVAGLEKSIVFPSLTGGYRQPSVLNKPFVEIAKAAEIERRVTAHTLRRTYNNCMRQVGVDKMILRAMTGHSSEGMTEHYSEVTAEEKRKAVELGLTPILDLVASLKNGG
jgi:integrase